MGKVDLQIKATLENLAAIKQPEDADWHFKIKCTNCQFEFENVIYFNLVERQDI